MVLNLIQNELELKGTLWNIKYANRIRFIEVGELSDLGSIIADTSLNDIDEVIHCAASLEYHAPEKLEKSNINLTNTMLDLSKHWECSRFVYISTAFCGGYSDIPLPEKEIGNNNVDDPNYYTFSKRQAELLVVSSGVEYLCLRLPIIIGDSTNGHYTGPNYGLYQLYSGFEKILCHAIEPTIHAVATELPIHFLHQDSFITAFDWIMKVAPTKTFANLVSCPSTAPSGCDLWRSWFSRVYAPDCVVFYQRTDDVPMRDIPRRQRAFIALASDNLNISTTDWKFERNWMQKIEAANPTMAKTSGSSLDRCLDAFIAQSDKIQAFKNEIPNHSHTPNERFVTEIE